MRKEIFGAALFFCGLGLFLSFCDPFESGFWRLVISVILMLLGLKLGGCC